MSAAARSALAAGLTALRGGDAAAATRHVRRALELAPGDADALHLLGVIAFQAGRLGEALAHFDAALATRPDFAAALNNRGSALMALGELERAEQALRAAVAADGGVAAFRFNLGNVLLARQRAEEATDAYRAALKLQPDYPEALFNLGNAYREMENLPAATACYEQALRQRPTYAEAAYNLANAYRDAGRLSEAEAQIRTCLALAPGHAKAHNTLGNILSESARSTEAVAAFEAAAALDPASLATASNVLSCLQYVPGLNEAQLRRAHAAWAEKVHELCAAPPPARPRDAARALRVGFVSPDLGRHPCGYLSVRLFEHLDRAEIAPVVFSTRREAREDDISRRIMAAADWRRTAELDDAALAGAIAAAGIDILIDMSGHTAGHRLAAFARRPAPIQMSWLGYVGRTGLPTIDFVIADRWHAPPGADAAGPERFLRLDDGYAVFDPPAEAGAVTPLPALRRGAVTFGCLNNATKLNPELIACWAAVLAAVAGSRMILRFRGLDDAGTAARVKGWFAAHGIAPERIDIRGGAARADFLATYSEIDIALDTFPYSGGLTTCEALWMGVPTVTFPGATFAGRHATSHMSNAGLGDFVAADRAGYERLAVATARDLPALAALRQTLRARVAASPLCDGARFAGAFARGLRAAWQTHGAAG